MEKALNFIYSRRKFAKSGDLSRITALLEKLGNPQSHMKLVHVVGTNGKGSTSTMISSCLIEQGYTVGLFTSPFVIEFRERIQINGQLVDKKLFTDCTDIVENTIADLEKDGISPTFFETVLAIAMLCFEKSGCSIAVLEAGIGGKDDSTNVIPAPEIAVITSVSFDHTDVLGDSLESIARHKCGVIKSGSSVVSFPGENCGFDFVPQQPVTVGIIEETCRSKGCPSIFPAVDLVENYREDGKGISFSYKNLPIHLNFFGAHQLANSLVAMEALLELNRRGITVDNSAIITGIQKAFIPCRMELVRKDDHSIILDGGHNVGCVTALSKMLKTHFAGREITAVLAFMKDKDYEKSIEIIAPLCRRIIFTLAEEGRGEDPEVLAEVGRKYTAEVYCEEDNLKALALAECLGDTILCAGSFYLVSTIRNNLKEKV